MSFPILELLTNVRKMLRESELIKGRDSADEPSITFAEIVRWCQEKWRSGMISLLRNNAPTDKRMCHA
jgi:hypothetical protein